MRTTAEVQSAARRAGVRLDEVRSVNGRTVARFLTDGWGAARLLLELAPLDDADEELREIGRALRHVHVGESETAAAIQEFVQSHVAFVSDESIGDFVGGNVEKFHSARTTLDMGRGDCDDQAVLVRALARGAGLDARIQFFAGPDGDPAHVVTEVFADGAWHWAETTLAAFFGEHPIAAKRRLAAFGRSDVHDGGMGKVTMGADAFTLGNAGRFGFVVVKDDDPCIATNCADEIRDAFESKKFLFVEIFAEPPSTTPFAHQNPKLASGDTALWVHATWNVEHFLILPTSFIGNGYRVRSIWEGAPIRREPEDLPPPPPPPPDTHPGPVVKPEDAPLPADVAAAKKVTPWLSDAFFRGVVALGKKKGMNPLHFLPPWMIESGLNPAARNEKSNASGLNQMMPSTLSETLHFPGSPADYRALSAEAQLPWIDRFMSINGQRGYGSAEQYYASNFLPLTAGRGSSPDTVYASPDDPDGRVVQAYQANRLLDSDGDGRITGRDFTRLFRQNDSRPVYRAAVVRLKHAMGGGGGGWWWVLGAAAAGGLGYWGWRRYRGMKRRA